MNTWMIVAIIAYIGSCVFFYIVASMSKTMDDDFTIKNLVITLLWPMTMWFLR